MEYRIIVGRVSRRMLIVTAAAWLVGGGAAAQEPPAQKAARELAHELMSPFCPGRTLADCPSPQAVELRDHIRARLDDGANRSEIVDELYAAYGEAILGAPRARGFGLLAWLVPGAFLLAGVWFIVRWAVSSRRRVMDGPTRTRQPSAEELERLEAEMAGL